MQSFPIFLNLAGQPVVVVGDGEIAAAKARLLHDAGAEVVRIAASASAVTEAGHARLGFVAIDDAQQALHWADRLRASGMLVNVADRPEYCDFTLPAIVDRSPLVIAISTGGASAGVAKWVRAGLEQRLPATLGGFVKAIAEARPIVAANLLESRDRRQFWDKVLQPGGMLDPWTSEQTPNAADIKALLSGVPARTGALTLIVAKSVDPEDLTLRMHRRLTVADIVVVLDPALLPLARLARRDATLVEDGAETIAALLERLMADDPVKQLVVLTRTEINPLWIAELEDRFERLI